MGIEVVKGDNGHYKVVKDGQDLCQTSDRYMAEALAVYAITAKYEAEFYAEMQKGKDKE